MEEPVVKCEECGQEMRKIGPFARTKPEGAASFNFDGTYDYNCINEACGKIGKILKVKLYG
ncbi:hypothetical protein KJ848_03245 [Patescibacteria group bacterium]|nr:hypothetical protein [Patescibacteria group bacterium]MBU2159173.1 hypothetical protein [Patescibacteria group bacterium]